MNTNKTKNLARRGLVIQGGGAKGAFALGAMKALQDQDVNFAAVSGTSAGALCAIIWSTGRLDEGIEKWKKIDHSAFFGEVPESCLRRLFKVLCVAGKQYASYLKNVDPEGRYQPGRDAVFSLLIGFFACLTLLPVIATWVAILCIPVAAVCAFANEVPIVGWDNRVRQWIADNLVFFASIRLIVSGAWMLLKSTGIVTMTTSITWIDMLTSGAILALMTLPVRIQTVLMEGKLLYSYITDFLKSGLSIPTYVTVAEEYAPNSPHFAIAAPGGFKPYYAALHKAPADLRAAYGYASAALPFGILPHVEVGGKTLVDGVVADNTPILPTIMEGVDEVWILSLRPEPIDVREHLKRVILQTIVADGRGPSQNMMAAFEDQLKKVKIVTVAPRTSLGGLLTGTLNFNPRRTDTLLRLGYHRAKEAIRLQAFSNAPLDQFPSQPAAGYSPRLSLAAQFRSIVRAFPPCKWSSLFARSNANLGKEHDFRMPGSVHPVPGEEGSPAWFWSIIIVWILFLADAWSSEHTWSRILWATLTACLAVIFPSWWIRSKRNLGLRGSRDESLPS